LPITCAAFPGARHAEFSGVAPAAILDEVRAMLAVLLLGR